MTKLQRFTVEQFFGVLREEEADPKIGDLTR